MSYVHLDQCDYRLKELSKKFQVHCRHDLSKKCVLFSKVVLSSLNVWPDHASNIKKWLMIINIISLTIMGLAHLAYVIINITHITKMTSASTTVLVSFETTAKLATMMYYREDLNKILSSIWHDFWPANLASIKRQKEIKFRSDYVTAVGVIFLCMAFFSNGQFMMFPLVTNLRELPLASWYPFDSMASPQYELLYVWQWFMNQIIITTLSGFDAFFNALVMICANQFQVMHDVFEKICTKEVAPHYNRIFPGRKRSNFEMDMLVKCVKHHLHLLKICNMLESIFSHIVFLQFVVSATAMCVSCVALIAAPELWQHMLSYLVAHVFQFFIYCSVGNELTYQSGRLAEAAYDCEWETCENLDFRKGLVLVLQRAQKPANLTVAGLMQLSYANFISTVQLSFSFYTLLNSFV